jgi:hypothetical protein
MIGEDRKNLEIKWIGVPKVDLSEQSNFKNRNIFPKRNKKGSNQLVINMLIKYDKCFGMNDESYQPFANISSRREKRSKIREKWIKHQKD